MRTRKLIEGVQTIRQQIEDLNKQIEKAQREYDLNKAAGLTVRPAASAEKTAGGGRSPQIHDRQDTLVREQVTEEEIATYRFPLDRHSGDKADRERAQ